MVGAPWLQFPSMSSLQGAMPSVTPSATMHPSNMGNISHAWNPHSSSPSYVSPPQSQTLAPAMGLGMPIITISSTTLCQGNAALYLYPKPC